MNHVIGPKQVGKRAEGTDILRNNCRKRSPCNTPLEEHNHHNIQNYVRQGAGYQIIKRPSGISDRAKNGGSGVIEHVSDHAACINPKIGLRLLHGLSRCIHSAQHHARKCKNRRSQDDAKNHGKRNARMNCPFQLLLTLRSVELRNHNRNAGSNSNEQAYKQIDQSRRRSANRR